MISNRELLIRELESKYLRDEPETFNVGDTVKVNFKIREGKRERVQVFEGIVIAMNGSGLRKTVTVRKLSFNNVNVERVFPLHSPKIDKIVLARQGRVRRAKLYYLRNLRGKAAQVKRFVDNKSKPGIASNSSDSSDYKDKVVDETKTGKNKPDAKEPRK